MNIRKGTVIICAVALFAATCLWQTRFASGQANLVGRTVTGTIYFIGGRTAGRSLPFTLIINRLTTAEEVSQLNAALQSGGQDEMLKVLSRMQAGRIQIGTGVGVPANAIVGAPAEGGTSLVVLYERNLRFAELRFGTRSADYKYGYAEIFLTGARGEGMLIPAAKVRLKAGNTWEVEDFGTYPARLMGLQVRGGREAR